jgi:hypothetical protein
MLQRPHSPECTERPFQPPFRFLPKCRLALAITNTPPANINTSRPSSGTITPPPGAAAAGPLARTLPSAPITGSKRPHEPQTSSSTETAAAAGASAGLTDNTSSSCSVTPSWLLQCGCELAVLKQLCLGTASAAAAPHNLDALVGQGVGG